MDDTRMRWPMSCEEAGELISVRLDLELSWHQRWLLRFHLSVCRKCAAVAQQLRALRDTLLGMPEPELPDEKLPEPAQERIKAALRQASTKP